MAVAGHESMLHLSWHDSAWIPILNQGNVMEYFSQRSNPFYDRQCNNEHIKMQQGLGPEHMVNMIGMEYFLLHAMEPILYVVRQQHRNSPNSVTPMADYYIIAGIVYQAPDLHSVINARMLNAVHNLESAFEEARSYSQYHPSKGYWWEFRQSDQSEKANTKDKKRKKEEPGSIFQRQRVDMLLTELANKFPPKSLPSVQQMPPAGTSAASGPGTDKPDESVKVEPKVEVKTEKPAERQAPGQGSSGAGVGRPPPEKRPKVIR